MSFINKLLKQCEVFEWTKECKNVWEKIKDSLCMYKPLF